ncbi:histidine--tRNA ligase [Mycoplasmopsis pullorum]|uniref:Histidine--tRNA ligase n=1 Tax=Mycoplasmopsis pullorum TaxID=48003 RepID=A0A1L4FSE3_9BACT|nr:histidine--tRNA ligase [Mycoplasmopsis pullorum]APJ38514.1 histidine--tRNA ligase [Mycoplasmopsis pullorum]
MFNKVKGTIDYDFSRESVKNQMYEKFRKIVVNAGYRMVETPILESASLFKRAVENSEIANKEMYEFLDKGDRSIVLRPEGTASFVRAYVENKWFSYAAQFQKFAYFGPMFRYEQPQKGRYRQFYQAGIEFIGEKDPYKDFEVIKLAHEFLYNYRKGLSVSLKINSIGDKDSRENYEKALYDFLIKHKSELSENSQQRLKDKKVLRILDDKVDSKLEFMKKAPRISDYLSQESYDYFNSLIELLNEQNIDFEIDLSLVRGLDYYDEIVFEFEVQNKKSAKSAVIGGGRYSNLIAEIGGPQVSSIGFGIGIDRIIDILQDDQTFYKKLSSYERECSFYISFEDEKNKNSLFNLYIDLHVFMANVESINYADNNVRYPIIFEYSKKKKNKAFDIVKKINPMFWIYDQGDFAVIHNLVNDKKTKINLNDETLEDKELLYSAIDFLEVFQYKSEALEEEKMSELDDEE